MAVISHGIEVIMSYNAVPTVTTGDTWSAANHNTYIRDNFAAGVPDIFTAAGDLAYATAANAAAPLAIGTPGYALLSSSDGLPAWGFPNIFSYRQGASSTDFEAGSSDNNYTMTIAPLVQIGSIDIAVSGSGTTYKTVTFPVPFSSPPLVFPAVKYCGGSLAFPITATLDYFGVTEEQEFRLAIKQGGSGDGNIYVYWIAIGLP